MAGTDPYTYLSDNAVLELATDALKKAAALQPGSTAWSVEWMRFDAHMEELRRRAMAAVLAAIKQERQRGAE